MKYAVVKARRPKVITGGMLVSIDQKHLGWLDKLLHAHCEKNSLRKMMKHLPNVRAIEVLDGETQVSFIVISTKGNGQFQIDHFTGENQEADFSIAMRCEAKGISVTDLTPGVSRNNFAQVSNFVIGILMYEFLMKTESNAKQDTIVPFDVFGVSIA